MTTRTRSSEQQTAQAEPFVMSFRQAMALPVSAYTAVQDVAGDDLDTQQIKIMLDYKQGRYQQASKRFQNLLASLGFDDAKFLVNQTEQLDETTASLLIFELLFMLKRNTSLSQEQLWKYVDCVSLFDPDDVICHGAIYNLMIVFFLRHGDVVAAFELAKMALEAYRRGDSNYLEMFVHLHIAYIHVYAGRMDAAGDALDDAHKNLVLCGSPVCENAMIQITRHWVRAESENILPSPASLAPLSQEITSGEFWPETFLVLAALQFRVAVAEGNVHTLQQHSSFEFTLRSRGMVQLLPAMQLLREECLLNEKAATGAALGLPERQVILLLPTVNTWRLNVGEDAEIAPKLDRIRALDEMHQARLWRKRGRFDLVMEHFSIAIDIIQTQGWRFFLASEHDFIADICKECRQRGRFVKQARSWQNSLLAARGGQSVHLAPPPMGLTVSELGILKRLPEITSNKGLALELGVSESTIKYHLKNLYRKLSVHSRRDAINAAADKGLI